MTVTIESQDLTRLFGNSIAVDKLNLSINAGEIFGLLGPNAAGKSTAIRLLAGILRADSGTANILGLDLFSQTELIKRRIGYVAQQFSLYPDLTVIENITFYASLYDVHDINRLKDLLEIYDLGKFENKPAGLLSGGYKRRLAIACATTHDPDVIFLDEPTAGIDPVTRKDLWDLFYRLSTSGKTLLVTTHYMEEAERCNRLAFLNHGKLVIDGTPIDIQNSLINFNIYSSKVFYNPELSYELMNMTDIKLVNQFGNELRIITKKSVTLEHIQRIINQYQSDSPKVTLVNPSIEDAFILLTSNDDK
jgi:ABC-type multidrug transport system ATPase subunit